MTLSGSFELPEDYTEASPPVFIVFDGKDAAGVLDDPFSSIVYFSKVSVVRRIFSLVRRTPAQKVPLADEVLLVGLRDLSLSAAVELYTGGCYWDLRRGGQDFRRL
ncbi:MAG: hypothetical protein R2860_02145 [Desulfobacterales bacterium]